MTFNPTRTAAPAQQAVPSAASYWSPRPSHKYKSANASAKIAIWAARRTPLPRIASGPRQEAAHDVGDDDDRGSRNQKYDQAAQFVTAQSRKGAFKRSPFFQTRLPSSSGLKLPGTQVRRPGISTATIAVRAGITPGPANSDFGHNYVAWSTVVAIQCSDGQFWSRGKDSGPFNSAPDKRAGPARSNRRKPVREITGGVLSHHTFGMKRWGTVFV